MWPGGEGDTRSQSCQCRTRRAEALGEREIWWARRGSAECIYLQSFNNFWPIFRTRPVQCSLWNTFNWEFNKPSSCAWLLWPTLSLWHCSEGPNQPKINWSWNSWEIKCNVTLLALPNAGWDLGFADSYFLVVFLLFLPCVLIFLIYCFGPPIFPELRNSMDGQNQIVFQRTSELCSRKHPFLHFCLEIILNSRPSVRLMSHAAWDPVMVPVHEHRASRVWRKDGGPMAGPRKTGTNQCQRWAAVVSDRKSVRHEVHLF